MFPLTFSSWYGAAFGPRVLEKANAKGIAVMAIKTLARQKWPKGPRDTTPFSKMWYQPVTDPEEQALSIRWTLSRQVTAILPAANDVLHRRALEIGLAYTPIQAAEDARLKTLAGQLDPLFKPGQEP
jgi:hypothetical protein